MSAALRPSSLLSRGAGCNPSTSGRPYAASLHSACRQASCSRWRHVSKASSDERDFYVRVPDEEYLKEYAGFKTQLMDNTRKCGAVVAAYLLFTVDGQAALCALLGCGASYLYLSLLYRDVDAYKGDTVVPGWEADKIENPTLRTVSKVLAAYRQALQPRLLVPVALAVLATAYNRLAGPEGALDLTHEACLLAGFLSYKLALVVKLVDELTPKTIDDGEMSRPVVERIEDELDMWGRPKKSTLRMPTDVLPEGVEPEKVPLAQLILAAEGGEAEQGHEQGPKGGQQPGGQQQAQGQGSKEPAMR